MSHQLFSSTDVLHQYVSVSWTVLHLYISFILFICDFWVQTAVIRCGSTSACCEEMAWGSPGVSVINVDLVSCLWHPLSCVSFLESWTGEAVVCVHLDPSELHVHFWNFNQQSFFEWKKACNDSGSSLYFKTRLRFWDLDNYVAAFTLGDLFYLFFALKELFHTVEICCIT